MPKLHARIPERQDVAPRAAGRTAVAWRIELRGRVQGLGVRPAVARLACELGLSGSVQNGTGGLTIHVEGSPKVVDAFRRDLDGRLPEGSRVEQRNEHRVVPLGCAEFVIGPSSVAGPLAARVPPDVAVCPECLADTRGEANRRRGYALTTCNRCGPRYSLIHAMPYDRAATGMSRFAPCTRCAHEYTDPHDRRFHSQTNACAVCGPRVWLEGSDGRVVAHDGDAVAAAVVELRRGRVLALRGVGGYQLLVDAASTHAVAELRRGKRRYGKPLAVMVADSAAANRLSILDAAEQNVLTGPANPIVVVRARIPTVVAGEVTAGLSTLGLLLPATVLHHELARRFGGPLVVTSGNLEGDPLTFDPNAARRDLRSVADYWLDHDRPIVRPIDDSVVRVVGGQVATVRLARGLAPLPLELAAPPMLALGAQQKAAIALSNGAQGVLGPHVGDLETEAARARYLDHVQAMCRLYGDEPKLLVCDEHPDYFTARWSAARCRPTMTVQHHHAHVAAGMLAAGWLDRQVLGVAWDGTGYGPDGTIWGGEFLLATGTGYRRVAALAPFDLPGGERAVREPWRVAVSLVYEADGAQAAARLRFAGVDARHVERLATLLAKGHPWPRTSSAGRLFDGIAALVLGATASQFEGQPAMLLEDACDLSDGVEYPLPLAAGDPLRLDWRPLVRNVLADQAAGVPPAGMAMRFHRALAGGIAAVCRRHSALPVVLCGGCFQNKVLTELVVTRSASAARLALPGAIPTGDGGLAAGQLAIAAARIAGGNSCV